MCVDVCVLFYADMMCLSVVDVLMYNENNIDNFKHVSTCICLFSLCIVSLVTILTCTI